MPAPQKIVVIPAKAGIYKSKINHLKPTPRASLSSINIRFNADLKGFSSQMQNVNRQLDKAGKRMQKVGKNLSTKLTAPIVGLGLVSVKTFADFEDGMAKVKAISGATGVEFKALEIDAKRLGETTRFTASQVAALQLNFSKLGFNPKEILSATGATLDLALATGEDLANSATVAASTLRGFGLQAAETNRVVDVMAASFSASSLNLEKFKVAMSVLAPVAKNAGLSIEAATGQLAVLVNAGVDASTAGTGLRNIYLDLAGSGKSLKSALSQIAKSSNKNAEAFKLFGKRGATVAAVLADNFTKANKFKASFEKAGGSAKKMAAIMDNTLKGAFFRLRSAFEGAAITIGEQLAPSLNKLTKLLTEAFAKFSSFDESTKRTIIVIGGLLAALGPVIVVTGTLIRNLTVIISLLKALSVSIAANPIGAFATAVAVLGGALLTVGKNASIVVKQLESQRKELFILESKIKDVNTNNEDRIKLIDELKSKYPKLLSDIKSESISNSELSKKLALVNSELVNKIILQKQDDKIQNAVTDTAKRKLEVLSREDKIREQMFEVVKKENLKIKEGLTLREQAVDLIKQVTKRRSLNGVLIDPVAKLSNQVTQLDAANRGYNNALKNQNALTQAKLDLLDRLGVKLNKIAKANKIITTPDPVSITGSSAFSEDELDLLDLENSADLSGLDQMLEDADVAGRLNDKLAEVSFEHHFNKLTGEFKSFNDNADAELTGFQKRMLEFNEMSGDLMNGIALGFVDGFSSVIGAIANGANAFGAIGGLLLSTLGDLATHIGKAAIKIGLTMKAVKLSFKSPLGAILAGSGLLIVGALLKSLAGSLSAKDAGAFANGGIVGGSSFYGDKLFARVNSGEAIFNQKQQKRLYELTTSSGAQHVTVGGEVVLDGQKLRVVLDRTDNQNSRLG